MKRPKLYKINIMTIIVPTLLIVFSAFITDVLTIPENSSDETETINLEGIFWNIWSKNKQEVIQTQNQSKTKTRLISDALVSVCLYYKREFNNEPLPEML